MTNAWFNDNGITWEDPEYPDWGETLAVPNYSPQWCEARCKQFPACAMFIIGNFSGSGCTRCCYLKKAVNFANAVSNVPGDSTINTDAFLPGACYSTALALAM